jgi:hypothetical protein
VKRKGPPETGVRHRGDHESPNEKDRSLMLIDVLEVAPATKSRPSGQLLTTHVVANGDRPGGSSVGIWPASVEQSFRILKSQYWRLEDNLIAASEP